MLTININNSTVTIVTNGEQVEVKTSQEKQKAQNVLDQAAVRAMSESSKQACQAMQTPWRPQVNPMSPPPFLGGVYTPQTFNHMYQPPQMYTPYTQPQQFHTQVQPQQINTFAGYPANPNYHPPHHSVENELKGKSIGATDEMMLPTLRSIPESKIGVTDRPWSIKDIVDTQMNTQTVSLQDIQRALLNATFWVKGYNAYTHKYAYNSWTKVASNIWSINDTIYESFISSILSRAEQMQTPNMHRPVEPSPYPQSVTKPAESAQTPVKPAQTLTDKQLVETLKTLPESHVTYTNRYDKTSPKIKYKYKPGITTKTMDIDYVERYVVSDSFFTLISDSAAINSVYLCWTKVASNTWTTGLEIEYYVDASFDDAMQGLKAANAKLAKHAVTDKSPESKPFDVSTAGLLKFFCGIKNPELWTVKKATLNNDSDPYTLEGAVLLVVTIDKGEQIRVVSVSGDSVYCKCIKVADDTWTVYKTENIPSTTT